MTSEKVLINKVKQKIIDLAYCIVELDQNEKQNISRGQSNYNRDPRNEQVLGGGPQKIVITSVEKSISRRGGNPMVTLSSKTEDGEELSKKYYTFVPKSIHYCYRELMEPLNIPGFNEDTSVEKYKTFDFSQFQGQTFLAETGFDNKGKLEVKKFLKVIKDEPQPVIENEEVQW